MKILSLFVFFTLFVVQYKYNTIQDVRKPGERYNDRNKIQETLLDEKGSVILTQLPTHWGFNSIHVDINTVEEYLRNRPLKPHTMV